MEEKTIAIKLKNILSIKDIEFCKNAVKKTLEKNLRVMQIHAYSEPKLLIIHLRELSETNFICFLTKTSYISSFMFELSYNCLCSKS